MKAVKAVSLMLLLVLMQNTSLPVESKAEGSEAKKLVRMAAEAIGGEEKLRALRTLRLEIIAHHYNLEVPERPEPPFGAVYEQFSELRDIRNHRARRTSQQRWMQVPQWSPNRTVIFAEGKTFIEGADKKLLPLPSQARPFSDWLDLTLESVLLNALEAKDLRIEDNETVSGSSCQVVAFSHAGARFKLLLNSDHHYPVAAEMVSAKVGDLFWNVWGDVTDRVYYDFWEFSANAGLRYPRQITIERNGLPYGAFTITELDLNPNLPVGAFDVPEDAKARYPKAMSSPDDFPLNWLAREPIKELYPGIVKISSGFDVALVEQPDGVLIIEAPTSAGFSQKVIAEAKTRFPEKKIKALIATDYYVAHQAGIREYVALRVPIYTLAANIPFFKQLAVAPHTLRPDTLARKPVLPRFQAVNGKIAVGSGANRLEIYPIRTVSGERMMMLYFPEHRLLYGSDIFQKNRDGSYFTPQTVAELVEAVQREKLKVDNVFLEHVTLTPWSEIMAAAKKTASHQNTLLELMARNDDCGHFPFQRAA